VFERFTEPSRQVVVLARDEARELRHNSIGTEHLLLGLLRERKGKAAQVLESLGLALEDVRAEVTRVVGPGTDVPGSQMPFTPHAKLALELALREAFSLGHNDIGPEHILLGLVAEGEGVASRILLDAGVTAETVRASVGHVVSGSGERVEVYGPGAVQLPAMSAARVQRRLDTNSALVLGWALFAVALGTGVLIGWAIWG
jgi:ATP-dependent Clp protease ATP-binding subunit ClpC